MPEHEYITLQVPEHLYLAVCGFMGNGAQAQAIPDHEIDRLGEQIRQLEAERQLLQDANENIGRQYDEARDEIERLQPYRELSDRQAARIRELESWRNELDRQLTEAQQKLLDVLPATLVETAAPEESPEPVSSEARPEPEAAAEPEPTAPVVSVSGKVKLPGESWSESIERKRGVPGAWTKPETKAAEAAAERFVAECLRPKRGGKLLAADLPIAYARWAKNHPDVPPEIVGRHVGAAAKRAGFKARVMHRPFPHILKSAQTYENIELVGVAMPEPEPESAADRRKREQREFREAVKRAAGPPREIVVEDDSAPGPYIAPKPKPKPGKQPILAVKNADQRPHLSDYSSVRVIQSNGVVTTVDAMDWIDPDEDTEPIKPEDADRVTFDLWTDVKAGMRDRPLGFLPDVLALEGVNTEELEAAVKHPTDVEIRPETRRKRYPVLGFRRGDVKVIVGFRDQQKPAVIAAYWDPLLTPDHHVVYRHGGGGAKKQTGLPTTVKQSVQALTRRGLKVAPGWEKSTKPVEVHYDGQLLGKITVHLANKSQVQGDYQRLLRQAHAIDRRKGLVSA